MSNPVFISINVIENRIDTEILNLSSTPEASGFQDD